MPIRSGRVVLTHDREHPYKVVLEHDPAGISEHPARTIREAEALIRERMQLAPDPPPGGPEWHI